MEVLEQIYATYLRDKYSGMLSEAADTSTWTPENRDDKIATLLGSFEQVALESTGFIKDLLETQIDGHPILYWNFLNTLQVEVLNLLRAIREQKDSLTPEEEADIPIDYDWLNAKIKEVYAYMANNLAKIETHVASMNNPVVEELS